jgi:CHAD domain-containing protein
MEKVLEPEDKWEVSDQFVLPPPAEAASDDALVERSTIELASVYYDTADHDLQHHGVSLRRREGDDDTGWQLKVPVSGGRLELRSGLSDTPPAELTDLLMGLRLGKPLSAVATIRTRRERYRIADPQKQALRVELVDDHVRASADHRLLAWREVGVEQGPAAGSLPRRIARRLFKAGARPARHPSKLEHLYPAEPRPSGSAAQDAVATYVGDQIAEVFAGDLGLRRGEDPIHDTRVAIRRLRSTLRVFGKVFDQATAGQLDTELKWFAGLLGEVRDCKLQRSRFHSTLDDWPPEVVLGPVIARIDSDLRSTEVRARRQVTDAMASARYLDLLATLQRWDRELPMSNTPTPKALDKLAKRARHKAQRRLDDALDADDGRSLHRARKAAKRARYAAELCGPSSGKAADKGKHFKRIQRVLGDHQDSVVAAATLYRLGVEAGTTRAEHGFTFGLLYAREQGIQESIRRAARRLLG